MHKIIIGSVVSFGLVIIACSAPPSGLDTDGETKSPEKNGSSSSSSGSSGSNTSSSSSSGSNPAPPSGTSTSTSPTEPPPAAAGACNPSQGVEACSTCCDTKFPAGKTLSDTLDDTWNTCICATNVCGTQCAATECSDTGPDAVEGDACTNCYDNATACNDAWDNACNGNADCKQHSECMDTCDP